MDEKLDYVFNIETWTIIYVVMGHNIKERLHTYKNIS